MNYVNACNNILHKQNNKLLDNSIKSFNYDSHLPVLESKSDKLEDKKTSKIVNILYDLCKCEIGYFQNIEFKQKEMQKCKVEYDKNIQELSKLFNQCEGNKEKIKKLQESFDKAIKEDFNTDYLGTLLPEVMYRISKYGKLSECEQAIKKLFSEKKYNY